MSAAIKKLYRFWSKLFAIGAGTSMFGIFLIITINSVRRYTLDKSFEWGEQLPVFLAVYGIMFGIAWAYMHDRHVRFTILVGSIPATMTRKLYLLVDLVMIATGVLLAYSGYLFAEKRGGIDASGMVNLSRDLTAFSGLDSLLIFGQMYPYQLAIAFGGVMLFIAASLRFLYRLLLQSGDEAVEVA